MTQNKDPKRTVVPIGPYHPLQEEPEFFRLHVEGEIVKQLDIEIGYNHRGIEKLSESKTFDQVTFLVERICGICSTSHPFAYVNAVEDAMGLDVPTRAKLIRTVIGELERIHSHLLWLGLAGHFLGYNTVWMWAWKHRETVCDILEQISGNRQHYAMFKIGGVRRDIPSARVDGFIAALDGLVPVLDMFKGAVMDDPTIHLRTKGVGVLTKEDIINYSAVGPTARASGVDIDVRRDDPYAAYGMVDFKVIVCSNGDIFDKIVVRVLEMYESVKIIKQCLVRLKTAHGPIETEVKTIPTGEGIGRHEAPRGEVFHYIRSDGTNRPVRHKIRAPSFMNVPTNEKSALEQTISDAALCLAAVDPCYCCTERVSVIRGGSKIFDGDDLVKMSQEKTFRILEGFISR
ncbi:MAG: nickel-dependent hydrogenase large subunit [Endomicrobiia bacterium]|nr:nickel-dependent hydrogenase large subunit [Endomicrobiia bacterium]